MKQKLDDLFKKAMSLITDYAGKDDPATVACIASTANRIRQLKDKLDEIEQEIPRINDTLLQYSRQQNTPRFAPITVLPSRTNGQHKSARKKIRIEIDWSRMAQTKSKPKEVICQHLASDSMTRFVIRLCQELGEQILPTLHGVRINRGPLVTQDPRKDYLNSSDGTLYQHQPILDTGYYVLTHSQTNQKVGDIQNACRALGLPIGMVVVTEVNKNDLLEGLVI
jgi:hypothetical protein